MHGLAHFARGLMGHFFPSRHGTESHGRVSNTSCERCWVGLGNRSPCANTSVSPPVRSLAAGNCSAAGHDRLRLHSLLRLRNGLENETVAARSHACLCPASPPHTCPQSCFFWRIRILRKAEHGTRPRTRLPRLGFARTCVELERAMRRI